MIKHYKIGTPVKVKHGGLSGVIIGLTIRGLEDETYVTYEVFWWDGRQRCSAWFDPWELDFLTANEPSIIGFQS